MRRVNILRALKMVWEISPLYCFIRVLILIVTALVPLFSARVMTYAIDSIIYENSYSNAGKGILIYGVLNVTFAVINCYTGRVTIKMNQSIVMDIHELIISKLSRVEYSFYDEAENYNSIEKASREIDKMSKIIDDICGVFAAILSIIYIIPYIIQLGFYFAVLIVVFNIPTIFMQMKLKRFNANKQKEVVYYKRCVSGTTNMLIHKTYAGEVRTYSLKEWLLEKFEGYFGKKINIDYERNKVGSTYELIINCLSIVIVVLMQWQIISKVSEGILTIGCFTLYNSYIIKMNEAVLQIVNRVMGLYEKELFMNNLFSFLDGESDKYTTMGEKQVSDKLHEIEFKNVSFKYANSKKEILQNVSFKIKAGQAVALVGLNGAGKTTIFNLILRFYRPQKGTIFLDGIDINEYDIESYYKNISVVFQSPRLYPFSLKENICFHNDLEYERERMHEWIKDLVDKYPYGVNTTLLPYFDPKGIEPSQGETQRIGLERALYKNASILLLDEPSASMDVEIEYKIFSNLKNICKNKTAIIISHRLSAVTSADCIFVVKDAKIVERGTHSELIKAQGEYAKLFNMQAEKYSKKKEDD